MVVAVGNVHFLRLLEVKSIHGLQFRNRHIPKSIGRSIASHHLRATLAHLLRYPYRIWWSTGIRALLHRPPGPVAKSSSAFLRLSPPFSAFPTFTCRAY